MITSEVNMIALAAAANAVVGPEQATKIAQLYRIIDDAMFAGYELGLQKGAANVYADNEAAFDNGYEQGEEVGHDVGYDDGYLDGVKDARATPAAADLNVASIISDREVGEDDDQFDPSDYTPIEDTYAFMEADEGCDCDECKEFAQDIADFNRDRANEYCVVCESYDCSGPVTRGS